ncbi:uncharacterized protein PSANT_07065 [Moesziomyces antarcticus]|uniref:Alpha-ketoglutarate-dependent dioxygenase AlkB-like domain-containing protein n=1 Tax=Pseudozyma antarctica TaxID=84753 RepID=A0A5C3FYR0_PSEA2|nr:uncharacterized protein PSANT_07065 [Moesziomyces antarcticus]
MPRSGPIIWSETRQELCESLPYYRAYQTGTYVTGSLGARPSTAAAKLHPASSTLKDSIPYGYLLAGWPSRRDVWAHSGRVIISHGGGKSEVADAAGASSTKKAALKQDQSANDSVIRALLHSSRHRLPIVLIAAETYALLPVRLPCSYAVLGWYVITDCWAEREAAEAKDAEQPSAFVRWKFRFEWIPAQGEPWWELRDDARQAGWDPRQRVERFSTAQRQMAKHMRGSKRKHASSTSPSDAEPSPSRSTPAKLSVPESFDESERDRLLYGPIKTSATLVSQCAATPAGESPCNAAQSASCRQCRFASPTVYDTGWMCLRPDCAHFFLLASSGASPDEELDFSLAFLQPQSLALDVAFPGGEPPFPLIPRRPSSRSVDQARGLWCSKCGRLSCREVIFRPSCAHCGHAVGKWKPWPTVSPPTLVRELWPSRGEAVFFDPVLSKTSGIKLHVRRHAGLVVYSFAFPDAFGDCAVHVVQADVHAGAQEDVADRLFREFQHHAWPTDAAVDKERYRSKKRRKMPEPSPAVLAVDDAEGKNNAGVGTKLVPFRRHVLTHHGCGSGRMLTQQFTCNYGVAYKHVVAMGTEPLDTTSPAVISSTLDLLHTRTRAVLASCAEFNELYPVLYLEHQAMSFHDDGEPGLGLKAKCAAAFDVAPRDRVVLDLPLRHGSVVVQQGHDLQRNFEHCVDPQGFRIAITARRIEPTTNDIAKKSRTKAGSSAS